MNPAKLWSADTASVPPENVFGVGYSQTGKVAIKEPIAGARLEKERVLVLVTWLLACAQIDREPFEAELASLQDTGRYVSHRIAPASHGRVRFREEGRAPRPQDLPELPEPRVTASLGRFARARAPQLMGKAEVQYLAASLVRLAKIDEQELQRPVRALRVMGWVRPIPRVNLPGQALL